MKKQIIFIIFIFIGNLVYSQPVNLSVSSISDEIKKNAYGVVRYSKEEFIYKSEKTGVEKHEIYITILDKKGKDMANFVYPGDKFRELKKFSGTLYDGKGKQIRKFSKSNLRYTELTNNLADDSKFYYLNIDSPELPFTIHYSYEVSWKKGIFLFPPFAPQFNYNLSVEKAEYKLNIPENLKIRIKSRNFSSTPEKEIIEKGVKKSEWIVSNLSAIESEPYSPQLETQIPILYISPETFTYDGVEGTITDWHTYGLWIKKLQEGLYELPVELKTKLIEMTKNAENDYEKVKIIYDYLGETTRYVSIQLGIGGYKSMPAAEVYKTGFGDCKALSNYLKSMLAVIGIKSNYIIIRMDNHNKTLMTDYPSFSEMNHAILQVPLTNDTLWLECTNPNIPFGFVHNGISGHDALEISEKGGRLSRLTDYPDSLNVDKNSSTVILNSDGSAAITSKKEYRVKRYNNSFIRLNQPEQIDRMRRLITLPNATIDNIQITEDKAQLPSLIVDYEWTTTSYGSQSNNRLFIPVNPLRSQYNQFQKTNRTNDINIYSGFFNLDSIYVIIPEGFEIESLPLAITEETIYGKFESNIIPDEKGILIIQSLYIPSGYYDKEEYNAIRLFFEKINSGYSGKIALRKAIISFENSKL